MSLSAYWSYCDELERIQKNIRELSEEGFLESRMSLEKMVRLNPSDCTIPMSSGYYDIPTSSTAPNLRWVFIPKNGTHYVMSRFKITHAEDWRWLAIRPPNKLGPEHYEHIDVPPGRSICTVTRNPDPHQAQFNIFTPFNKKAFIYESKNSNTHTFTIIREPISRIISSYSEMLKLREDLIFSSAITKKMDWHPDYCKDESLSVEDSFVRFLQNLHKFGFYDPHVAPQIGFLESVGILENFELFDFMIPFDCMESEIGKVSDFYGIRGHTHEEAIGNFINKGSSETKTTLMNLINEDSEIFKIIKKLYKKDFELYKRVKDEYENNIYR